MKNYFYFVSYNYWNNEGYGFGNVEIPLNEPISNIETIHNIQDEIKNKINCNGVSVNNYILLRES